MLEDGQAMRTEDEDNTLGMTQKVRDGSIGFPSLYTPYRPPGSTEGGGVPQPVPDLWGQRQMDGEA